MRRATKVSTSCTSAGTLRASIAAASAPEGFIYVRGRDGRRFRLLIVEHGVDDRSAFITFDLADDD